MNFSSELQVVSRVDEGTDVDGETTETERHLLQDVDDVVHVGRPLEVESVTSIDVDPSAREGLDDFLDSGGKCNLELSIMVFSSLVESVHKQSRFQNKDDWDFLEIFGVFRNFLVVFLPVFQSVLRHIMGSFFVELETVTRMHEEDDNWY